MSQAHLSNSMLMMLCVRMHPQDITAYLQLELEALKRNVWLVKCKRCKGKAAKALDLCYAVRDPMPEISFLDALPDGFNQA